MLTPVSRVVPDVLEAYEIFLRELVGAGNSVIVPTPAYMPFLSVPKLYDVNVIEIEMLQSGDTETGEAQWLFDFDAIERAFAAGCHASCFAILIIRSAKCLLWRKSCA